MDQNYIGHPSQISGVEEHRLVGGRGDGMRLLELNNGSGIRMTISADRCADIARLSFQGVNMGYFSPAGYVAPAYYDCQGDGFLKSFTAGFLTTCGLYAVGSPCVDQGESLPLHGSVSNMPAEHVYWTEDEQGIDVYATIRQEGIFASKLVMERRIHCSKEDNWFTVTDRIGNRGGETAPCMVLYHMNMGYPLLDENSILYIPSAQVKPRNARAQEGLDQWDQIIKPQPGFEEQCYYHRFDKEGLACIFNPSIEKGLEIRFDASALKYFTQWKMMGCRDYVLGLEPGNCHPDGRDVMRREGALTCLEPGGQVTYQVRVNLLGSRDAWEAVRSGS